MAYRVPGTQRVRIYKNRGQSYSAAKRAQNRAAAMRRRKLANARRAQAVLRQLPVNEMKYVDGFLNNTAFHEQTGANDSWADCELDPTYDVTGGPTAIGCMPMPALGNAYFNRDGRKIFVDNIKIRGVITFDFVTDMAAAIDKGFVRLIVYEDTKTSGVQSQAENVMGVGFDQAGDASSTGNAAIMALSNPNGWSRYNIIKSKIYSPPRAEAFSSCTDPSGANPIYGENNGVQVPFKFTIRPKCHVNFSGDDGLVGSVIDRSWHLIGIQSTVNASAKLSYVVRTSFKG
jgi:hypothetical protein